MTMRKVSTAETTSTNEGRHSQVAELVDVKIGKRKFRVIDMSGVSNLTFNLPYTGSNPVLTTNI